MSSRKIRYKDAIVTIRPRDDGRWVVYWREGGAGRNTTAQTEKDAEEKAKAIAARISISQGGRILTIEDAQIVERVKKLAGNRPAFAWLGEIEDAQQRLKGVTIPKAVGHYIDAGYLTVQHVPFTVARDKYLLTFKEKMRSKLSLFGPKRDLAEFDLAYPGVMLTDITQASLETWLSRPLRNGKPASKVYFNGRLKHWKAFLTWCKKKAQNLLPEGEDHAAANIERQSETRGAVAIWEPEIPRAILAILPHRLKPFLIIGNWLGLRPSEIQRLTWEHFDWKRGYLHVDESVAQKVGDDRFVPMTPLAKQLLAPWMNASGRCCATLQNDGVLVSKLAKKHKIITRWPVDVMRHSYISYRIASGVSKHQVAEESGNSERIIKQHYRRPLRKEDGKAWFQMLEAA